MFKWKLTTLAIGNEPTKQLSLSLAAAFSTLQQKQLPLPLTRKTTSFYSPDSILALAISVGLVGLLVEAYNRTDLHSDNVDSPHECRCIATSAMIQPHHVQELQRRGIVIIPAALSAHEVHAARRGIENLRQRSSSSSGGRGGRVMEASGNDADVRQDCIIWIQEDDGNEEIKPKKQSSDDDDQRDDAVSEHLIHCVRFIRGVKQALEDAGYNSDGRSTSATTTTAGTIPAPPRPAVRQVVVPRPCQLALYPGDSKASYARHLDACTSTLAELGLLEWWRLSDYRQRVITVILYLNEPDRHESDGGVLRCWANPKDREESFDIVPKGGTLVIFQSDLVEHMVLPSSVDRYALTNWVSELHS